MNRRGLFSAPIKIAFPHMNYIVYGYYGSYGGYYRLGSNYFCSSGIYKVAGAASFTIYLLNNRLRN